MRLYSLTLLKISLAGLVLSIAVAGAVAKHRPQHKRHPVTSRIQAERSANERALAKLQQEIAKYESELNEHEKAERKSRKNIQAFNRRTAALKATIAHLHAQAEALRSTKKQVDETLHVTASTLDTLKGAYARSSRALYVSGALRPLDINEMMLAPTPSDPVRMAYYTELIARAHAMNRTRLDSMKQALASSSHELAGTIASEQAQIGEHQTEAETLAERKAEESQQLAQIQANKQRLEKLIAKRRASAKRLEKIIDDLVLRERAASRRSRIAPRRSNGTRRNLGGSEGLGPQLAPHSLAWPSTSHHIIEGFGEHRNAALNTVTMSLGIDIGTRAGSSVRAAASGIVAVVSSLPSYGTIIVLEHSGGLHTVYANLSKASVRPGESVRTGTIIGASGESDEGTPLLHFEVWNGKSRQNPMGWLK